MFHIADKQAKKSPFPKHKLGAVIVKGGRVLSTGYNEVRYSKYTRYSTVHAEEAAIIKLLDKRKLTQLVGADLFVTRICPSGNPGLARPCDRCMGLIKSVGIKHIHYSTSIGTTETCCV
jgi:deoxycytidylate deaminase